MRRVDVADNQGRSWEAVTNVNNQSEPRSEALLTDEDNWDNLCDDKAASWIADGELPSGCFIRGNTVVRDLDTVVIPDNVHFLGPLTIENVKHLILGRNFLAKSGLTLHNCRLESPPDDATIFGGLHADAETLLTVPGYMRVLRMPEIVPSNGLSAEDKYEIDNYDSPYDERQLGYATFCDIMEGRGMSALETQDAWNDA